MQPEILGAIIGPLITAALAGTAVLLRSWSANRRRSERVEETLERRRAQVGFIDSWLTAHQKVAAHDPRAVELVRQAVADLDLLYQQMTTELHAPPAADRGSTGLDLVKLLLLVPLHSTAAKVARVFYYLFAVIGAGGIIATMATIIDEETAGEGVGLVIFAGIVLTAIYAIPAVVLWIVARGAERSFQRRTSVTPGSSPPGALPPAPPTSANEYTPTGPRWAG